jgi:serine/threonine protein kinase
MIGTTLQNRYHIEAELGEGGMGTVYRAYDTLLDLPVALASAKDYVRGARLLAFAEVWRKQRSIILPPPEQPYHDEAIRILREALDEETLAQARQVGEAMTLEQAMTLASEPLVAQP